jgi:hypothetical protein
LSLRDRLAHGSLTASQLQCTVGTCVLLIWIKTTVQQCRKKTAYDVNATVSESLVIERHGA